MYDLLIRDASIVDGTGNPAYRADIGVVGERIVEIRAGLAGDAREIIDAGGRVMSPGFIDAHTHDDLALLRRGLVEAKMQQGVTTAVIGNCGFGLAPVSAAYSDAVRDYAAPVLGEDGEQWQWESTGAFFDALQARALGQHVCALVPHGVVRAAVMGFKAQVASEPEMAAQESLVREAMQAGAAGMSLGLAYVPGRYATTGELVRLGRIVGGYGGVVASHMRGEGDTCIDSIHEMLTLAEQAEVAVHISHLKLTGRKNWGQMQRVLDVIADARARGIDITVDVYPYAAGSTTITQVLPPWMMEGGIERMMERLRDGDMQRQMQQDIAKGLDGWENPLGSNGWERVYVATVGREQNKQYEGKNLVEIGEMMGMEVGDALARLMLDEEGRIAVLMFTMDERDVDQVVEAPFSMIGSDGLPVLSGRPHPRLYGTFPRFIKRYVRERKSMSLEEAVAKVTAMVARRFGLAERGVIAEGKAADLVIFDAGTISDRATFEVPQQYPEGIAAVVVAGQPVVLNGAVTANWSGKLLVRENEQGEAIAGS